MMRIRCFVAGVLLAGWGTSTVWAQAVETRNHRQLSVRHLRLGPAPLPLKLGETEWHWGWTAANDFRAVGDVIDDYELHRFHLNYRRHLGRDWEGFVEAAYVVRGGGFMDPLIDGWHQQVLGWSDPIRDGSPMGRTLIQRFGVYEESEAQGIADLTVGVRRSFGRYTAQGAIKLPTSTGSTLVGTGRVDVGVGISRSWSLGRVFGPAWTLQGDAGLVAQSAAVGTPHTRGLVTQLGWALVWAPNSRDQWIAQWQHEDSPTVDGSTQDAHRLITFGYRRSMGEGRSLTLFFSEDRDVFRGRIPEIVNVGPDFTIGIQWTVRY